MELVDGRTLKELVTERGPLPPEIAISLTEQILRALGYAHRRGIVHRDIKPQNVIIDGEGQAKVADFGIARAGETSEMTQTGAIVGTVQYLSPEQAEGHPVDRRADLYSAGIVLYELLTGQVPFDGEAPISIAIKQINEPPVPPRPARAAGSRRRWRRSCCGRWRRTRRAATRAPRSSSPRSSSARRAPARPVVLADAGEPSVEEEPAHALVDLGARGAAAVVAIGVGAYLLLTAATASRCRTWSGARRARSTRSSSAAGSRCSSSRASPTTCRATRSSPRIRRPATEVREGSTVTVVISGGPGRGAGARGRGRVARGCRSGRSRTPASRSRSRRRSPTTCPRAT